MAVQVDRQFNQRLEAAFAAPVADDLIGLVAQYQCELGIEGINANAQPRHIDAADHIGRGLPSFVCIAVELQALFAITDGAEFQLLFLQQFQ